MKKILAIIGAVLAVNIGLSVANNLLAVDIKVDDQVVEESDFCCRLKHNISIGGSDYEKGSIIGETGEKCSLGDPIPEPRWAGFCLVDSVATITDWIKFFAGIITVLAIIIAGVMFITAGGNPEKAGKAKKMLLYSIIGIAVVVMAHMVPSLIKFFV